MIDFTHDKKEPVESDRLFLYNTGVSKRRKAFHDLETLSAYWAYIYCCYTMGNIKYNMGYIKYFFMILSVIFGQILI